MAQKSTNTHTQTPRALECPAHETQPDPLQFLFVHNRNLPNLSHNYNRFINNIEGDSIRGRGGSFLMEAGRKNAHVFYSSAHVRDPQVVKVNPEASTTARQSTCVVSPC